MTVETMPESIELTPAHLRLRWADRDAVLDAITLRAACRCAHCRAATLRAGVSTVDRSVTLAHAQSVGRYALQLTFSDGHARGIYPWCLLRELSLDGTTDFSRGAADHPS